MTVQEKKRAEAEARLKNELKQKVRKDRPTAKVLELTGMMIEDQLEQRKKQEEDMKWKLKYIKTLDPAEIEPDE